MNSLYGRFGMDPNMLTHIIINNAEISKHMSKDNTIVKNLIDLNNNKSLISTQYSNPYEEVEDSDDNINIGIASAKTSYARIYMSTFL
jgi:DNA polymerase type B, organellar and viral